MNEKKIKEIVKKSKLETSSNFTDTVLQNLEAHQKEKKAVVWPFGITFIIVSVLVVFQSYTFYMFFGVTTSILNHQSDHLKAPIFLLISALLLLGLNYIIRMHKVHQQMKDKPSTLTR